MTQVNKNMFKQILLLLFFVVIVKSQVNNSPSNTDDYLNLHRRQYARNIKDYDLQLKTFERSYDERLNTNNVTTNMLNDALKQNEGNLNSLEIISDFRSKCIKKYRPLMPKISDVKTNINSCISIASNQKLILLASPRVTRNNLEYYYTYSFENDITNCNKTYGNPSPNYTMCVTSAISTANIYTTNNQKTFTNQMNAAQFSANNLIESALDCSISAQNRAIYLTAEVNTFIDQCSQGFDDCERNVNIKSATSS